MPLFSKKDKYIRINPLVTCLSQNQKFQMSFFPSVQVVSIPFIKKIWGQSVSVQAVATLFGFQLLSA